MIIIIMVIIMIIFILLETIFCQNQVIEVNIVLNLFGFAFLIPVIVKA